MFKKMGKSGAAQVVYCIALTVLLLCGCKGWHQKQKNRLQNAFSPYLKEHADNPVDWYEWGDEALNRAKKENKPLLISIGYASCHWCHVMEKESFMDTAVARVMNENFICIKVDREERPDIDNIYMNALQLISGETGWPLNAFALPDGKPFFAGTYYAKKNWTSLLLGIAKSYTTKHNLVVTQANAMLNGIAEQDLSLIDTAATGAKNTGIDYKELYDSIYKATDQENGGLKGMPKFPTPAFAEFLLQHYSVTGNKETLKIAGLTLKKMALGGIYDQVGGGFARYATDSFWKVPHFEKMLYDNGQLLSVYAHAYQLTKDDFYKKILDETIVFMEKSLAAPGGGYFSSLSADSDAGEGEYYAWKKSDFEKVTGTDQMLATYFHVSGQGNWKPGSNILYASQPPAEFAVANKISPGEFTAKMAIAKSKLLNERSRRIPPVTDSKIITAWNGMVLKGYADAYAATGTEDYLIKARACASFIEKNMLEKDGGLKRSFHEGKDVVAGFLDDYAWAALAFTRLYQVSFETRWITLARTLTDYVNRNFYNATTGLFYYASKQNGLVLRKTEVADDAVPSANAVMAKVLYTLGIVYDDTTYSAAALRMYNNVAGRVKKMPCYHIEWCSFAALLSAKPYQVVIMGKEALIKNKELQQNYLPAGIVVGSINDELLPLMQGKLVAGKTLVYTCTNKMCKKPEEEIVKVLAQLPQKIIE
ncbi:thioredoxin domain-containing protein [Ferruginibacter profundus]